MNDVKADRSTNQTKDLRGFISKLDEIDELKVVEGADWNLEIGAITEIVSEQEGPALLFDKIKDYSAGFRVISNIFRTHRRVALAAGLPEDLTGVALLDAWRHRYRDLSSLAPVDVGDGPVFENDLSGDAVDLETFPAPIWHEPDGGRYLGTGCGVITRDPDTGKINIGTYRCMIQGRDRISVKLNKGKHGRMHMEKYHARNEPCPIAITIGHSPTVFLASMLPVRPDVEEYGIAGSLLGEPVEVVNSRLHGLPIPATSEIVLEGEIPPLEEKDLPREGPFGEWMGYFADTTTGEVPLMTVKRIYYRDDPIILGMPPLKPPNHYVSVPLGAGSLWDQLEAAGIPEVKGVWGFVYSGQSGPFTVVSIKQSYAGHAKQTALVTAGARGGAYGGKFVIVVDDDVDITNPSDVIWAMSTRCDVREGVDIVKSVWTTPAEASIKPSARAPRGYTTDRVLIDACRPYQWADEFPDVVEFSQEFKQKVTDKWDL